MASRMARGANGKPQDLPVALDSTPHHLKPILRTGMREMTLNGRIGKLFLREAGSGYLCQHLG